MSAATASSDSDGPISAWEDEAVLLRQVADGDQRASRIMVDRYLQPIHRFAFRMIGDRAEAEDIAQEAFVRLWRQAPHWKPQAKLSTWLYRVAKNLCVDRLRARTTRRTARPPEPPEPPPTGASLLERRQLSESVQAAIEQLPERQRAALVLIHYQGLRSIEAAEILDVKVTALESLLARARRQLRKRLRPLHQDTSDAPPPKGNEMMEDGRHQRSKGKTA